MAKWCFNYESGEYEYIEKRCLIKLCAFIFGLASALKYNGIFLFPNASLMVQ